MILYRPAANRRGVIPKADVHVEQWQVEDVRARRQGFHERDKLEPMQGDGALIGFLATGDAHGLVVRAVAPRRLLSRIDGHARDALHKPAQHIERRRSEVVALNVVIHWL